MLLTNGNNQKLDHYPRSERERISLTGLPELLFLPFIPSISPSFRRAQCTPQTFELHVVLLFNCHRQDWSDAKPYNEGRRISAAVQFWAFHMAGLRADLYTTLPPGVAQPMFARLLSDSLGVLAVRYCQVCAISNS